MTTRKRTADQTAPATPDDVTTAEPSFQSFERDRAAVPAQVNTSVALILASTLSALDAAITLYTAEAEAHNKIGKLLDQMIDSMPEEKEAAIQRIMDRDTKSYSAAEKAVGTDPRYRMLRDQRATLQSDREAATYRMLTAQRRIDLAEKQADGALIAYKVQESLSVVLQMRLNVPAEIPMPSGHLTVIDLQGLTEPEQPEDVRPEEPVPAAAPDPRGRTWPDRAPFAPDAGV